MNRLLKVSLKRLFRDKILYIACIFVLLLSLYISFTNAPEVSEWMKAGEEDVSLDTFFYNLVPLLGMFYAAFTSLFIGVEYSDGTLRNKIAAGHSRSSVFISFFFAAFIGCALISMAWLLGSIPGLTYFTGFEYGWSGFAIRIGVVFGAAMAYAAIFTAISMMTTNKALSGVICLSMWFALLFIGSSLVNMLDAGVWGSVHTVIVTLCHLFPICPAIRMSNGEMGEPLIDILWFFGVTATVLIGGCALFGRKDLK